MSSSRIFIEVDRHDYTSCLMNVCAGWSVYRVCIELNYPITVYKPGSERMENREKSL